MSNTANKVINIAKSQVGYIEKSRVAYQSDASILYKFTDGAGNDNYTKYGKEMHTIYPQVMDFPAAWCDCFVDWCFYQAYGLANAKGLLCGDFNDYTVASAQLYKNKGVYFKAPTVPKIGDQIFFKNDKRICHTGLVVKVDDKRVYTIEGNTSNGSTLVPNGGMVCEKSYPLNYEKIDGYGRPKYDTEVKEGWVSNGKDWCYYSNGEKTRKEWIKDNHHWYRLGPDGTMLVGWHKIYDDDNNLCDCYFDETTDNLGALWHEREDKQGYLEVWNVSE